MCFLHFLHCYVLVTAVPYESVFVVVTYMSKITGKGCWLLQLESKGSGVMCKPQHHSVTPCGE